MFCSMLFPYFVFRSQLFLYELKSSVPRNEVVDNVLHVYSIGICVFAVVYVVVRYMNLCIFMYMFDCLRLGTDFKALCIANNSAVKRRVLLCIR